MTKLTKIIIVGVIIALCVCVCCMRNASKSGLDVGAILALTGSSSFLGVETRAGIEVAVQMLNEDGIPVNLYCEDSANTARKGLDAFQKLSNVTKVQGVVIAHSGVAGPISDFIAASPVDSQNHYPVPICTMVSTDKVTENNHLMVRCFLDAKDEFRAILDYVADNNPSANVGIVYQNDDLGLEGLQQFNAMFDAGKIQITESFDKTAVNVRSIVSKVVSNPVDVLLVVGNTPAYASIIRQLRESGFKGVIVTGSTFEVDSLRAAVGESALKGVLYVSAFSETEELLESRDYLRFKEKIIGRGMTPNMLNVYSASAILALVRKLREVNIDNHSLDVSKRFENAEIETPLGKLLFDSKRNARAPAFIKCACAVDVKMDKVLKECR